MATSKLQKDKYVYYTTISELLQIFCYSVNIRLCIDRKEHSACFIHVAIAFV